MFEAEFPRLNRIEQLLQSGDHATLETLVIEEMPKGLLSEPTLDAARVLRRNATVVFLASLAVENLPKPFRFQAWLAVYQSIVRGEPTGELGALPGRHPLRLIAEAVVRKTAIDAAALKKGHGLLEDWCHAAELARAEGMLQAADKLEYVVEILTSASEELSAQIEQSSRGAEQQSGRVGETATAMEQMNATVLEESTRPSMRSIDTR